MNASYYCKSGPEIVTESIDGEVVIINLDSGSYFSLEEAGAYLWDCLCAGLPDTQIIQQLEEAFPEADARQPALALIESLVAHQLVQQQDIAAADAAQIALPCDCSNFNLECYTDMKELLMLDPIHEVEEAGWPRRQEDSAS